MTNDKILICLKKGFICMKFKSYDSFKKNNLAWVQNLFYDIANFLLAKINSVRIFYKKIKLSKSYINSGVPRIQKK